MTDSPTQPSSPTDEDRAETRQARRMRGPLGDAWHALGSLRLTVVLLAASVVLIFFGTLDQVQFGIRLTEERYFRSLLTIWSWPAQWQVGGALAFLQHLKVPLPGGYLVGPLLVLNLIAAHFRYFRPSWAKAGIAMLHGGVVLLLVSQLVTQLVQEEYSLWLKEGETGRYLESFTDDELVFLDTTNPDHDRVISIPTKRLVPGSEIRHPLLPFTVVIHEFFPNAAIVRRDNRPGSPPALADQGIGAAQNLGVQPRPRATQNNERDITTAVVELRGPDGSLGRWLVSNVFDERFPTQSFTAGGRSWEVALRIRREYLPFSLQLEEFIHERYPGTDIPRHFASRLLLHDPAHAEPIATTIQMNEPLRHGGYTFYQASFTPDDTASMLQVVRNPGWTGPYIACSLITFGMIWQFWVGFARFLGRRRTADKAKAGNAAASAGAAAAATAGAATAAKPAAAPVPLSRRLPLWIGVGLALLILAAALAPQHDRDGFPLQRFGDLPTLASGRIKPIATEARHTLLLLNGKQTWRDADGVRRNALEFAADLLLAPDRASAHRVFRVDHPDLKSLLKPGGETGDRKVFSFSEIEPHLDSLRKQLASIPQERARQTVYDRALEQLMRSVDWYLRVAHSAAPASAGMAVQEEYARFADIAPAGFAAVQSHQQGGERDPQVFSLFLFFAERYRVLGENAALSLVPPPAPAAAPESWTTVGRSLLSTGPRDGTIDPAVLAWAKIADGWRQKDATLFTQGVADLEARSQQLGLPLAKLRAEAKFHHFNPFTQTAALYVLAFLLALGAWIIHGPSFTRAGLAVLGIAFTVHTLALVARILIEGRPPVTNLYSSAVFIGWGAVLLALVVERLRPLGVATAMAGVTGFTTLVIAHHLSLGGDTMEVMRAVLNSNFWLATHVVVVTFGYSATFAAGILAAFHLVLDRFSRQIDEASSRWLHGLTYGIVCFALLFSFVGTILGGIWADQSWGRFWGWDPKENGAAMIVLWNALLLHARWGGLVRWRGFAALALGGNIITAWSWFGTNLLGVGLHAYGFTDKGFVNLMLFVVSQLALMLLAVFPRREEQPPAPGAAPAA